ncbi:MAG: hypothetical protein H9535_14385 [Ignavibacteria bacterium]|nr:hypothetical protein [Ignavibacteria bacterium]
MVGDIITIRPEYYATAARLYEHFCKLHTDYQPYTAHPRKVIVIGGESGSGKSVTATTLQMQFEKNGSSVSVLHLDDYFYLPPSSNHARRLESLSNVGIGEVNMMLLQEHLDLFKAGTTQLTKPLAHYQKNYIGEEILDWRAANILIIEGTYALGLERADYTVFMKRTYLDTRENRLQRARSEHELSSFVEEVLAIEHGIVAPLANLANVWVEKDYSVTTLHTNS